MYESALADTAHLDPIQRELLEITWRMLHAIHTGDAATYANSQYPNGFAGYSVVAYLPNPSHNGNAIILTGTDSDATAAAAEFLTSEEQLKDFQNTLHVRKFPYFEVLLKTSRLSGTSLNSEILAYRTYPSL